MPVRLIEFGQFHIEMLLLLWTVINSRIEFWKKKWHSCLRVNLTHWPLGDVAIILIAWFWNTSQSLSDWHLNYFLWKCPQEDATEPHWCDESTLLQIMMMFYLHRSVGDQGLVSLSCRSPQGLNWSHPHHQNTHCFLKGHTYLLYEILNNHVSSVSHMVPGPHFENVEFKPCPVTTKGP